MNAIRPYRCQEGPSDRRRALVVDSPHSGGILPDDMRWQGDLRLLLVNEDVGVDTLFADVPPQGVALLSANISRHYIDLNRALDASDESEAGGLIRKLPGQAGRRSTDEINRRIETVWLPYHRCLAGLLRHRKQQFGSVWHLNAHSMPAGTRDSQGRLVDIVLGDRYGTTAARAYVDVVASLCLREGLVVSYNDPYAGVECVRRHGLPDQNCHSLQFEIGRQLFYDEERFRFLSQMETLRVALNRIVQGVIAYTESNSRSRGALAAE